MKKLLAILLALVMVLSLCACSGSDKKEDEEDSVLGLYVCTTVEVDGEEMEISLLGVDPEDYTLELEDDDVCVLTIEGESVEGEWKLEDDDLTLSFEEDGEEIEITGTLKKKTVVLDIEGDDWTFELEKNKKDDKDDEDDEDDKKGNINEPERYDNDSMIVIGDFESEYLGCEILEDDEGKAILAVVFEFTNNSSENQSFAWAYFYDFAQDGEDLYSASVYPDPDGYDTLEDTAWEDIEPGDSAYVFLTYYLNDFESVVDVEFSDMYNEEFDYLTIDLDTAEEGLVEYYY